MFFYVMFLEDIADIYWIIPCGSVMWGVARLPPQFTIFVVAILFSALPPYQRPMAMSGEKTEMGAFAAVSKFKWILFIVLLIAFFAGIFQSHPL